MAAFAERGPVPEEGRCLWCGAKLRTWLETSAEGVGYGGRGFFCTLTCGWHFGLRMAELGRRLRTTRSEPV